MCFNNVREVDEENVTCITDFVDFCYYICCTINGQFKHHTITNWNIECQLKTQFDLPSSEQLEHYIINYFSIFIPITI